MRVLVSPTAFKGSFGAREAAEAMARGVREARPDADVRTLPLSDGGPGLLDALRAAEGGELERVEVSGPMGSPVSGRVLWPAGREAVVESADACGLHLVPEDGDPLRADTRGVGELVRHALAGGAEHVVVGLGGSASSDGGTGLGRVFGFRFLDEEGRPLPPGGGPLRRLGRIAPGLRPAARVTALADVLNPLTGMRGAAREYGPQKGATAEEVELLVEGLERLAERLARDLSAEVAEFPGTGAAGGLGAGCAAFLGARIVAGSEWVMERAGFEGALPGAGLVVTGEGAYDATSAAGKITGRVLERCRAAGTPALLVCGRAEAGSVPEGVGVAEVGGAWLGEDDLARLTAGALREAPGS